MTVVAVRETGAALTVDGLTKAYGAVQALDAVGLEVPRGGVHGLLGRNGAGKTTLLRCVLGLVRADGGTVAAAGTAAGFVESPRCYPYLTVSRNLELLAALDAGPGPSVTDVLEVTGLAGHAKRKVGTLSTGMAQRVGIAAALLRDPDLLVLDEPTTGLDPSGMRDLHELIAAHAAAGRSVLLSSHDMAEVELLCDSLTVLRAGRAVYTGGLEELRAQAPAPSYRLVTSDDRRAAAIVDAERAADGLVVRARQDVMDEHVLRLARAGIAVRNLTRRDTALEALFVRLTDG